MEKKHKKFWKKVKKIAKNSLRSELKEARRRDEKKFDALYDKQNCDINETAATVLNLAANFIKGI